jgi:hypothetical protein
VAWISDALRYGALGIAAVLAYYAASVTRVAIRASGGSKDAARLLTICLIFLFTLLVAGIITERLSRNEKEFIAENTRALFDESSINMRPPDEVPHCQSWLRRAALLLRQLGDEQNSARADTLSRVNTPACEDGINEMAPIIHSKE